MKNILIIFNKHNKKGFLKEIKNDSIKSNLIFIEDSNKDKIISKIHNADAIINCPRKYFDKFLLEKAKKLKWVHTGGAGIDTYLIPEFVNSNIVFTNGKILQGPEIADHTAGLLLCITRNLHLHINKVNQKSMPRPIELKNKTCGILGMGGIGLCVAERLKSFGMKIIGISEELIPLVSFVDEFYTSEKLLTILPKLDVLVCAAPYTKDTSNLLDEKHFNKMKKNSIFINVSRGKIVKVNALLKNNLYLKFRGIGLDVTNPEPLPQNHKLNNIKNIIVSNHSAGLSDKNRERSNKLVIKNIKRFLKNKPLLNVVDKIKGY
jgi:D-2-hydroxyacid dehydrogenase (NADP+)